MNVAHPIFTADGCLVEIDGWAADIETKRSILLRGLCSVTPLDLEDEDRANELTTVEIEPGVFACNHPQLVDLAQRHHDWCNDARKSLWQPFDASQISDSPRAVQEWIARNALASPS